MVVLFYSIAPPYPIIAPPCVYTSLNFLYQLRTIIYSKSGRSNCICHI